MSSRYAYRRGLVAGLGVSVVGVSLSSACWMLALVVAVLMAYRAGLRGQPCATPVSVTILWVVPVLSRHLATDGRVYHVFVVGASGSHNTAVAFMRCCLGKEVKALVMSK